MSVESDADLAVFFNADEFGVAAFYTPPGGDIVECVVLKNFSDRSLNVEYGRPIATGRTLQVLDIDVTPVRDGVFTIAGTDYTVQGDPKTSDPERKIWSCTVALITAAYAPSLDFSDARNSQYLGQVV